MKQWHIIEGDTEYTCSLMSLAGSSKLGVFGWRDEIIRFQFMKFYDFSRAKDGKMQTGWVKLPHTDSKVRAQIIFR